CALISVGSEDRLDPARKLVKTLKDGSGGRLWVAVGGAVLDRDGDVLGLTGADMATNDPTEVLGGAALAAGRQGLVQPAMTEATGHRLAAP
ncbi:MAG: hypothetical protein EAZ40_06405, partial [Rhodobacterales bacterium]